MTGRYCLIIQRLWLLSQLIRIYLNSNGCYLMYSAMYYYYYHHIIAYNILETKVALSMLGWHIGCFIITIHL